MFLLRRTAARAVSASPSSALFVKPRSITTFAPTAFRSRQPKWTAPAFQRRFASDEAVKTEEVKPTEEVKATEEASQAFAQTAAEAPIEENLTPAQESTQPAPAEASTVGGIDALEEAVDQKTRRQSRTRAPKSDIAPNTTLYVGNLFFDVKEEHLERLFSRFGEILTVRVVMDNTGRSRGFGYVQFKNLDDARAAMENLHMQIFQGRNMVVMYHVAKRPDNRTSTTTAPKTPTNSLFIGNMSFEMSDKDLNDLFRDIRNVLDVRVAIDRRTGQPRGFAHADFIDVASATIAKEALSDKVIYGRPLRIDYSRPATRNNNTAPRSREQISE